MYVDRKKNVEFKNMKKKLMPILIVALLAGCADYKAYDAERTFSGITIEVTVVHNHPLLAEYKRYLRINGGSKIDFGQDTGGSPFVNVFETKDVIILQSLYPKIAIINKVTKDIKFEVRPLRNEETSSFIGKFTFDKRQVPRLYTFIPVKVDASFNPYVLQGG